MPTTSLALSNLRAYVILVVLGFHSVLAYLSFLPSEPYRFDAPPYDWQAFAIIDSRRWIGFDLFCAWNDVCLMSLMFFVSGLFTWPSLVRKQSWNFLRDRLLRLGLPLVLAVYLLMPIALYPTYLVTAKNPSVEEFLAQLLALPFWPCGPQWFLWQLLALNIVAAALHRLVPGWGEALGRLAARARTHPGRFVVALIAASALAYIPLALLYSPWSWYQIGPFAFQHSRPLHYTVYFLAGAAVGAYGIERGLLASDGELARRWPLSLAGAIMGFAVWIIPTAAIEGGAFGPLWLQVAAAGGFVVCCASGCLFVLAVCVRFATRRRRLLDSLSGNAYGMYLVHYPFVVWMQFALLDAALPAIAKAAIVFVVSVALSWGLASILGRIPFGGRHVSASVRAEARVQ